MGTRLIHAADALYRGVLRPMLFTAQPDAAHAATVRALGVLDRFPFLIRPVRAPSAIAKPVMVGGVQFPGPLMVAAGLVKGHGFDSEASAVEAAKQSNIIPGWRSVPMLCGPVEIGSFTRYPRMGNPPPVLWRDVSTRSTQNRIGLRNPGALAASAFLRDHRPEGMFGLSVATTPGESDPALQAEHISASVGLFLTRGVRPDWFTINLSCPNTEDDPQNNQTSRLARQVCEAAVAAADGLPVWVKIGPDLSDNQYQTLAEAFSSAGVQAVIATNTLAAPVSQTQFTAGLGGGRLFESALSVVLRMFALRERFGLAFDLVGCGGIMDGKGLRSYTDAGASAVQVWSALVYRGPFAPTLIAEEYEKLNPGTQ